MLSREVMRRWLALAGLVLALGPLAGACRPALTPTPAPVSLRLAATDLTAPLLADLIQAYAAVQPGAELAANTLPLRSIEAELAGGGAELALVTAAASPFATPLGYVDLVVVVNPANPLSQLSPAQVRAIFAGRVADWAEVGGPAGSLVVACREDRSDGAEAFGRLVLEGAAPTLNARVTPTWAAMRALVSQTPEAIGYLPAPEVDASVRALAGETGWRALVAAVAPAPPGEAARAFLAWVQSAAGQAVVARRYQPLK